MTDVERVMHHLNVMSIFLSWVNCLDCTARFSKGKEVWACSAAVFPAWVMWMSMKDNRPDLTVCKDSTLGIYDPWPSVCVAGCRNSVPVVHSGTEGGLNNSWLHSRASQNPVWSVLVFIFVFLWVHLIACKYHRRDGYF